MSSASRWLARFFIGSAFRVVRAALTLTTIAVLGFYVLLTAYNSRLDVPLNAIVSHAARFDLHAALAELAPWLMPVFVLLVAFVLAYSAYRASKPDRNARHVADVARTMLVYVAVPVVISAISWLFPVAPDEGYAKPMLALVTLFSYVPITVPIVAAVLLGRAQDLLTDRFETPLVLSVAAERAAQSGRHASAPKRKRSSSKPASR